MGTIYQDIEALMKGKATSTPKYSSFFSSPTSYNSKSVDSGSHGSMFSRVIIYILSIAIVIFVILLFIDRFFKQIFSLQPGDSGIIPVPWFDNGVLFWDKVNPGQILNKDLPISELSFNYSLILDMFIQNPLQFSKHPRILFSRGAIFKNDRSGDTILGILNNYNLVIALLPDTNDLIVSVLNKDNNMEIAIVSNIPVQEPFRIGIVIMEAAMEVYLNGKLMKTRAFHSTPKDVKGDIYPASGIELNIAKLRNLKIWPTLLTSSEIRSASPSLSVTSDFGVTSMPTTSTCGLPSLSTLSNESLFDIESVIDSTNIKVPNIDLPDL
jgi:hypothetical protein